VRVPPPPARRSSIRSAEGSINQYNVSAARGERPGARRRLELAARRDLEAGRRRGDDAGELLARRAAAELGEEEAAED
jgi:hypothetical protein